MGRWLWLAVLVIACAGCGPSGPKLFWVQGAATWQGEPIEKGNIVLVSLDPNVSDDAGEIVNGRYRFEAKAGKKSVRIYATKEGDEVDPVMGAKPQIPLVPAEYSGENSPLIMEVTATGANTCDFKLPLP